MVDKEYIEREAAIKEFSNNGSIFVYGKQKCKAIVSRINAIPAADVRPVVLCKDCMYAPSGTDGGEGQGFALEWPHDEWPEDNPCPCKCEDGWYSRKPEPDFFCANGKREEN